MTPLIRVDGVSKYYPRVHRPGERLRAFAALLAGREPREGAEVLHDVSLEVFRGQSFGIIGENGAGKSTLLKILTGVLTPSRGSVEINARVAALLELGAGFQPEFSGISNCFNGWLQWGQQRLSWGFDIGSRAGRRSRARVAPGTRC